MYTKVAVLLTCFNRREKTLQCLETFTKAVQHLNDPHVSFHVFLVDDGSTDNTGAGVRAAFPGVHVVTGSGQLFWAGGMRLAWKTAIEKDDFDFFLLLNDDVKIDPACLRRLFDTHAHSLRETGKGGLYTGITVDETTGDVSYGGHIIRNTGVFVKMIMLDKKEVPQRCHLTSANILLISRSVYEQLGILDEKFTHSLADYDYTLKAHERGIPVWIAPGICGECTFDHGVNWKSSGTTLKERLHYLKSPKGLAYSEYLKYVWSHFPFYYPTAFGLLWLKTLFPFIWDTVKDRNAPPVVVG